MVDQALVTLLVFGFTLLLFLDLQQVWHLYVFALAFGFLWAGNNPVRQVLVANTVPREALMHAVAMSSMAFNSGPPGRVGAVLVLARPPPHL